MNYVIIHYVLIPVLIMVARIFDVSIGTVRIIFVSKGKEKLAAFLGFFEVLIWLIAISQVLNNLTHFTSYIGYALGFALGNIIGIMIEKNLAVGMQIIRIIKRNKLETLQMILRDEGYGVTTVNGRGGKGKIDIVYVVVERKNTPDVMKIIKEVEPDSFVTIQDIYSYQKGYIKKPKLRKFLVK